VLRFGGETQEKEKYLEKSSLRLGDNIEKDLRELRRDVVDWIDVARDISKCANFVITEISEFSTFIQYGELLQPTRGIRVLFIRNGKAN
jgi:hypothetical protein